MSDLSHHNKDEEEDDLPLLEKALEKAHGTGSAARAKSFERTKMFVPTKSHPSAGEGGGLFETAMGLMAAPIDKLSDMFMKFPK